MATAQVAVDSVVMAMPRAATAHRLAVIVPHAQRMAIAQVAVDSVVMAMHPVVTARHSAVTVHAQPSVIVRHGRTVTALLAVDSAAIMTARAATSAAMAMPPDRSVTVRHVPASAGIARPVVDSVVTVTPHGATARRSAATAHHVVTTMHHAVTPVIAHDHASAHNLVLR
jgi:hypothetical protein